MNINPSHLILSKNSIHIYTAITLSLIIFFITWHLNNFLQKLIIKIGNSRNLDLKLIKALSDLIKIFIYSIGTMLFLENLKIELSSLLGTLGVIAIGIGFALQEALANVTSGLFILYYKPFSIGDYIVNDKVQGKVIDINLRMTILEDEGNKILIPNHILHKSVITIKKEDKPS